MVRTSDLDLLETIAGKDGFVGECLDRPRDGVWLSDAAPLGRSHPLFTNHHKALETTSPNLSSRIFAHACRRAGGEMLLRSN